MQSYVKGPFLFAPTVCHLLKLFLSSICCPECSNESCPNAHTIASNNTAWPTTMKSQRLSILLVTIYIFIHNCRATVCFLDRWPKTKYKVTFDICLWYSFNNRKMMRLWKSKWVTRSVKIKKASSSIWRVNWFLLCEQWTLFWDPCRPRPHIEMVDTTWRRLSTFEWNIYCRLIVKHLPPLKVYLFGQFREAFHAYITEMSKKTQVNREILHPVMSFCC